jgi:Aspartyl/Asparaginyl beta-hydroxylase
MDKNKITRLFAKTVTKQTPHSIKYDIDISFDQISKSGLPWLILDIGVPYAQILTEIKNISHLFVDHRDEYNTNAGWQSFCIHGKSYNATRESEFYDDDRPYTWTQEAIELMPLTVEYFKNIWPCYEYDRLRIMKLSPGAIIEVHQDNFGPSHMHPINIAITQPTDCNFYVEDNGIIPFIPGLAVWIDVGNRHCVINDSKEERYHIIIHQKLETKEFKDLVIRSYHKNYGTS